MLLYGSETSALKEKIESVLRSCDRRLLRYMTGVTWRDGIGSTMVATRRELRELCSVLAEKRLRWLGHIEISRERLEEVKILMYLAVDRQNVQERRIYKIIL